MIRTKPLTPDVFAADEPVVNAGRHDLEFLKQKVRESARHRVRLCAHKNSDEKLQEMFIVFGPGTYIRPSKHLDKEESLHVLEGSADFVFFDDKGAITQVVAMGDYASGKQFYCRTPSHTYHMVIPRSELLIVHETTQGPFKRSDTEFASWSPADEDAAGVAAYLKRVDKDIEAFRASSDKRR